MEIKNQETVKLSANFTLREMVSSYTAKRKGIDNTPSVEAVNNLGRLCRRILQPIRDAWGEPIIVSSGYRCPDLNRYVKGAIGSDHIHGCAADIKTVGDQPARNKELFDLIRRMYKEGKLPQLKQVIDEYHYDWLHVAFQDGRTTKIGQFIHIGK
ncbi:MAG: peptidase M15 [Bacteroidaceae bacterium]|nr:peptidase M15 [Bacteroidaceae bacterium]